MSSCRSSSGGLARCSTDVPVVLSVEPVRTGQRRSCGRWTRRVMPAAQHELPPTVRLVVVPDAAPKTKPKACNVGLLLAPGEYLVIYDAEDRPEPAQLRKAVVAFRAAGEETVCVQ